ncbi:unnamed protein product [Parascedosporium putredinis]|uniref:Uncharacterized protein n=1 Tax=Parascedosporium putredinis TaxID=1442378 RepID=A0A9P1GVN9_9PEZI|nr:unnamed protein product [Parascedosporium putredinis]CAI7988663.1 unnamed protein product [Parascedosporium putredinis]
MGSPFTDEEKRFLLAEMIKVSKVDIHALVEFVKSNRVEQEWLKMQVPNAPTLTSANHLIEGHSTEPSMPTNSAMQPHRGSTPQHVLIKPRLTTANGTPSPSPSAASEPPTKKRRGRPPKVQSYDRLGPGRPRLLALAPQPPPSATAQQQAFAAVPQSIDNRSRRTASPAYTVSPGPNIENIAPSRGLKRSLPDHGEQTQPAHLHPRFIPPDESGLARQRANASGAPTPLHKGLQQYRNKRRLVLEANGLYGRTMIGKSASNPNTTNGRSFSSYSFPDHSTDSTRAEPAGRNEGDSCEDMTLNRRCNTAIDNESMIGWRQSEA